MWRGTNKQKNYKIYENRTHAFVEKVQETLCPQRLEFESHRGVFFCLDILISREFKS